MQSFGSQLFSLILPKGAKKTNESLLRHESTDILCTVCYVLCVCLTTSHLLFIGKRQSKEAKEVKTFAQSANEPTNGWILSIKFWIESEQNWTENVNKNPSNRRTKQIEF